MKSNINRRDFVTAAAAVGVGLAVGGRRVVAAEATEKPALLGGKRAHKKPLNPWPIKDETEERAVLEVLRSGKWFRGGAQKVDAFEQAYAKLTGAKHCIATNSGTSALIASLGALGIGPGDEVIVTPYTFIASITAIMLHHALPVFVDIDPATFLIDPKKIEAAITDRTAAVMPVHIGGNVSDMDAVLAVAKAHNLPVVEDACQAHLAQWRGRSAGTWGTTGCFSFQVTKNLPSGEGGAILTDDDVLAERIYAFHNNCRARKTDSFRFAYAPMRAANFRMTEFQGALLTAQMTRLEKQSDTRNENALYLAKLLGEIPGLRPAKMYDGCTRNAWHLFMMRYDAKQFAGLPRAKFMQALNAEGIPCMGGYETLPWAEHIKEAFDTRGGRRTFPAKTLEEWPDRCRVPEFDKLCKEAVWFTQTMFLGERSDMDEIAAAARKIHTHAAELAKA